MEDIRKSRNNSIIIILIILVIALGGYIGYDKLLKSDTITEDKTTAKENNQNETEINNEEKNNKEDNNYVKTRVCTGTYKGTGAVAQNIETNEYIQGLITIILNENGTYELIKEDANGTNGEYTIIENALLLKTTPENCGPGSDCSASYSQYLSINEDCSKISSGYGSYFFDSEFTLNRQN